MSRAAAKQAGCASQAAAFGAAVAKVDSATDSQLPVNSFWHAMSDGFSRNPDGSYKETLEEARKNYNVRVDTNSASCKIDDLATALHDVQDSWSPAHEGMQRWAGVDNINLFALALHGLKDAFPTRSAYGGAVQQSADIISQAASRCPCLCGN